jgi:uncharacterized RDD family membrane protein YckC
VDSAVLIGFVLVFIIVAGSILLFASDLGTEDASDSAYYASIAVFLGGTLISWSAANVAAMRWRGQTAGMYLFGLQTIGDEAPALSLRRATLRWIAFHPLLFHPVLAPVWLLLTFLVVSLTLSQVVLVLSLALVLLSLAAPAVSLVSLLLDPRMRALHDRLAGTRVVHLDQR